MKYLALLLVASLLFASYTTAAPVAPFAPAPFIHINMSPHTSSPGQQSNIQGYGFAVASHPAYYVVGLSFDQNPPAFGDYIWLVAEPYYIGTLSIGPTKTCTETLTVPFGTFTVDTVLILQVWEDTDLGSGTDWRGSDVATWVIDV